MKPAFLSDNPSAPLRLRVILPLSLAASLLSACSITRTAETFHPNGKPATREFVHGSALRKADDEQFHLVWTKSGPVIVHTVKGLDEADIIDSYGSLKGAQAALNAFTKGKAIDSKTANDALKAGNAAKQIDADQAVRLKELDLQAAEAAAAEALP